jgi:hypothetical protein
MYTTSASLLKLLNRHGYEDALRASPFGEVYDELTDLFYELDPVGLRGFPGLPRDEYGPEALRVTAELVLAPEDLSSEKWQEALWAAKAPESPRDLSDWQLLELFGRAFVHMFGPGFGESASFEDDARLRACLQEHGLLAPRRSRDESPRSAPADRRGGDRSTDHTSPERAPPALPAGPAGRPDQ